MSDFTENLRSKAWDVAEGTGYNPKETDYGKAADKIEQLQQRVGELEEELANAKALQSHSNHIIKLKHDNEALAAHVEVLSNALVSICDEGISFDFEDVNQILEQSPQTSLAEVKAKAVEDFAQHCYSKEDAEIYMWDLSDVKDEAKDYAAKIRDGDKL